MSDGFGPPSGRGQHHNAVWLLACAVAAACLTVLVIDWWNGREPQRTPLAEPVFFSIDVRIDPGDRPLAAWQLEVIDTRRIAQLVGVEGGDHAVFAAPPKYDPAALQQHRVVLAALTTDPTVPRESTRVATLHFAREVAGTPRFQATMLTAAEPNGASIPARVEIVE